MPQFDPIDPYTRPARPENNLAIAGFICSIVGIMTCGFFAPVGLIISLFALRREPRAFAVAGAIIGGFASCGAAIAFGVFFVKAMLILAALGLGTFAIALGGANIEAQVEMADIAKEISVYEHRTNQLPASLDLLPIVDPNLLTDHWNNKYVYRLSDDAKSYRLYSLGPDGLDATPDDIDFNQNIFGDAPVAPSAPNSVPTSGEPI